MSDEGTVTFENASSWSFSKSGQALECVINGVTRWIPVSLIHDDSEIWKPGQKGKLVLPEWFCIKEGLV